MSEKLLEEFLEPLRRIVSRDLLLERVKDLEGYYKSFCEQHKNDAFADILSSYEETFKDIDKKDFSAKKRLLEKLIEEVVSNKLTSKEISKMEAFLSKSLLSYKGVGQKVLKLLEEKGLKTVRDLIFFLPYGYIDKRSIKKISQIQKGEKAYLRVTILNIQNWQQRGLLAKRSSGLIALVTDGSGFITLKWFYTPPKFIRDILHQGKEVYVFGKIEIFRGTKEIHHPEVEAVQEYVLDKTEDKLKIYPVYFGLPAALSDKFFRKLVFEVISEAKDVLKCLLPDSIKNKLMLCEWGESLRQLHFPEDYDEKLFTERRSKYHLSLLYQELFLFFALLIRKKLQREKMTLNPLQIKEDNLSIILNQLNFKLTNAQKKALYEIKQDLQKPNPMHRLLQGDVGSGKTIVALLASLMVLDAGKQVVLMAPTEILATQHFINFRNLLETLNIEPVLLVSGMKKKTYIDALEKLKNGETKLIIGTHALIQEGINFNNLGLVIIDEQHRFGVNQRAELVKKGFSPHVLYLTATPIPRTLTMTLYGDLNLSIINEMPPGRKPPLTIVLPQTHREKAFLMIEEELRQKRQAYVVYPVIDENNTLELKAATKMYEVIRERFSNSNVALLHGRMTAEEKEDVMKEFKAGITSILVSTTVIEVGVDVPNATIMVIEHGERFGLSSLHQLRGRIGRGGGQAKCVVLVDIKRLSEKGRERLIYFRDNTDGFKLAEFDLKLRGPGEILGTRQSGLPEFSFVDLIKDAPLIELMKKTTEDYLNSAKEDFYYRCLMDDVIRLYFAGNIEYAKIG